MKIINRHRKLSLTIVICLFYLFVVPVLYAQFAPGSGLVFVTASDDFESGSWGFNYNFPKSSSNLDGNVRSPLGRSVNNIWEESSTRGQPDVIERVLTPSNGLSGSNYAIRIRSLNSGAPGSPSGLPQQDDIIGGINQILRVSPILVTKRPSIVARIRIPPPDEWESSVLSAFSFRVGVEGTSGADNWPGMFFQLNRSAGTVKLIGRANQFNQDYDLSGAISYDTYLAPKNGWMTVGFSFTEDGRMHYYAGLGAGNLGDSNLLDSRFPGNQPVKQLEYFFSSTVNTDNGITWGPAFHLDDVFVYTDEGTLPNVPAIRFVQMQEGSFRLNLEELTVGAYYDIERSVTLEAGSWSFIDRFLATATFRIWEHTSDLSHGREFLRIQPSK